MGKLLRGIGGFIFWTHERGTWQYDVMVGLILAFVFFTPRGVFHDRPQLTESGQVKEMRDSEGKFYRVEARLIEGTARSLEINAELVIEEVIGRPVVIRRLQPLLDAQGKVQAYTIWIQEKK